MHVFYPSSPCFYRARCFWGVVYSYASQSSKQPKFPLSPSKGLLAKPSHTAGTAEDDMA
jgi:hypothetical protein